MHVCRHSVHDMRAGTASRCVEHRHSKVGCQRLRLLFSTYAFCGRVFVALLGFIRMSVYLQLSVCQLVRFSFRASLSP